MEADMRSQGTGESWVARPLPADKFFEEVDPEWIIDHFAFVSGVSVPALNRTQGTRRFSGSYQSRTKRINYTKPYAGVLLHELAHHICHERGLNGRGNYHDHNFGEVLQDMIDLWV